MTARTPACEDSAAIAERLAEIQRARMQAIAGCSCPGDLLGNITHTPICPMRLEPASQMELAREAIQRARERQRRTADDYIAEGIAAKYARHRVLS